MRLTEYENDRNEELLQQIEELDKKIDKNLLKLNEAFLTKYQNLSNQLIKLMSNEKEEDRLTLIYNQRALKDIKTAVDLFRANEKTYKKGDGIDRLVALLAGWNSNVLFAPTQTYFHTVYQEIFSKLDPSVKVKFTEMMINQHIKEIS